MTFEPGCVYIVVLSCELPNSIAVLNSDVALWSVPILQELYKRLFTLIHFLSYWKYNLGEPLEDSAPTPSWGENVRRLNLLAHTSFLELFILHPTVLPIPIIRMTDQTQLREERLYFIFQNTVHHQGKPRERQWRTTAYWFAPRLMFSYFLYSPDLPA